MAAMAEEKDRIAAEEKREADSKEIMNKRSLDKYLSDNLKIKVNISMHKESNVIRNVDVRLELDGEVISKDSAVINVEPYEEFSYTHEDYMNMGH